MQHKGSHAVSISGGGIREISLHNIKLQHNEQVSYALVLQTKIDHKTLLRMSVNTLKKVKR